jgi:head-tail adaptor
MNLERRVQFYRSVLSDDGFGRVESFAPSGATQPARKRDVSDGEKYRSDQVQSHLSTRFVLRYSAFTAGVLPQDRLLSEGLFYEIVGIKSLDARRKFLEFTCAARNDQLPQTTDFSEEFSAEFS